MEVLVSEFKRMHTLIQMSLFIFHIRLILEHLSFNVDRLLLMTCNQLDNAVGGTLLKTTV